MLSFINLGDSNSALFWQVAANFMPASSISVIASFVF